jgi:phosphatidylinositol kinase/protein kinase (PI-3  family)
MAPPQLHVPHTHSNRGASPLSTYLPPNSTELAVSLENVFEEHCIGIAKDPAFLLQLYREKHKEKPTAQAAAQFLNDVKSSVPDSLLLSYVSRHLSHPSHLVLYKKQFAQQLAVKSLFGFLLSVIDRSADKLCFIPSTGQIYQRAFVPTYTPDSHVLVPVMVSNTTFLEALPWRLSRSLVNFLSPLDIDAHLASTMAAAAVALNESRLQLNPHLMMFFRDEVRRERERERKRGRERERERSKKKKDKSEK